MPGLKELEQKRDSITQKMDDICQKCVNETRALTEQEDSEMKKYKEERTSVISTIAEVVEYQERSRPPKPQSKPAPGQQEEDPEKRSTSLIVHPKEFRSVGEQLQAIALAKRTGRVDQRLIRLNDFDMEQRSSGMERRAIQGMSETVDSDGGFFMQPDFAAELYRRAFETGVLASRCRKVPLSQMANALRMLMIVDKSRANGSRMGGVVGKWLAEGDSITASKPKFKEFEVRVNKWAAAAYMTDELIKDVPALGSVVGDAFSDEAGYQLDDAILNGSGVGEPLGFTNSGCKVSVPKDASQAGGSKSIIPLNIVNMRSRLPIRSRGTAVWLVNQDVEPSLHLMAQAIGTAGGSLVYMPANGLSGTPFDTLYGRPVIPIEQAETLGTEGDISLVDFMTYMLVTKGELQTDVSMHVEFLSDQSVFRFILRVGGSPLWSEPITPAKGANTLSPYITLATR